MFLPDGRVLIMNQEDYNKTIEKSIVLDLLDSEIKLDSEFSQLAISTASTSMQPGSEVEDEKQSTTLGSRLYKDSNRKQSQANQKRGHRNEDDVRADANTNNS